MKVVVVVAKPSHLSSYADEAWDRIVAECAAKQIDCSQKYDVLERYAVTYDLWLRCQAAIRSEGQAVTVTRDGVSEIQRNPRMPDYHQLTTNLGRIRNELGLGPLASSKQREQEDDDREKAPQEAAASRRRLKILGIR